MDYEDLYFYSSSTTTSSSSSNCVDYEELIKLAQIFCEPFKYPKLTVFLDLDNTLIYNCTENNEVTPDFSINVDNKVYLIKTRPYLKEFLRFAAENFDVYIYTAGTESYAKELFFRLNKPKPIIKGFFSRNDCINCGDNLMKDLSILNSDLSRTVLIDDSPSVYADFPKNGIPIKKYMGEKEDHELIKIEKVLLRLNDMCDVREQARTSSTAKRTINF